MRHRLLVVAKDAVLRSALARWLMPAGYTVELAESGRRAREVIANHKVALTILVLDGCSGSALVRDLGKGRGKLIVVTKPPLDLSAINQFAPAADACLSLPLDEQEVLARVESLLQPQAEALAAPETLSFEGFTIDLAGRSLRDASGSEVALTRSEFALLLAFARHTGWVLSRDQLLDAVLGRRADPYDRSIDVLVGRLRRKIEADPKLPRVIVTVIGEGYKFAAKPQKPARSGSSIQAQEEQPAGARPTERRQLTVICCGLVGSTALASRLDPEDLRAVFAEYHRCCAEVIAPFGGIVAPFAGDRVLVYFGYPEAHENDAERAVRAGLALIDAVAKLATRLAPSLHVRVLRQGSLW
jgi:DNA-binding response OmpR family regulator